MKLPTHSLPTVAYICAEFALQSDLPTYAGGLGVLAGDILRGAVDAQQPMIGLGLLYQGKFACQSLDEAGWQHDLDREFDLTALGYEPVLIDQQPLELTVPFPTGQAIIHAWRQSLGATVEHYWLDINIPENPPAIRELTRALYFGDDQAQLQQSLILGVGGAKLLAALGKEPKFYHLNEGRPAFIAWELLRQLKQTQPHLQWPDLLSAVQEQIVYTNHTLVAAGNLSFTRDLVSPYAAVFAQEIKVPVEHLLDLAVSVGNPQPDRFSITDLALNVSVRASGVSQRHTQLAAQNWPQYSWQAVTNAVHFPTWQKTDLAQADTLSDDQLWQRHRQYKHQMVQVARERTGFTYDPDRLIIGWARRIALYKQLDELVWDAKRLAQIMSEAHQPMQLLVAGKAHPGDQTAKEMLQKVIQVFQTELSGVALFIPDYNVELAQAMVAGTDVWLNFPEPNMEASGTSGMKAISNGVLPVTTMSGWATEEDWTDIGWVLDPNEPGKSLYQLLEEEVGPTFYKRNQLGLPSEWIERMRQSMKISEKYAMRRLIQDYQTKLYQEDSANSDSTTA